MKRRVLAVLLTLCMALSLLPVTALAATGYDDNWYHYRQKWMYTVTASKVAVEENGNKITTGENIRETTDGSGHGTTPTIEFGTVTYGNAASNELTLTFKNTTTIEIPADNSNHWGEVYVTIGSRSKYFDFEWDSKNGKINKGESSTVTITPRNDIPAGSQEETVVFMEQNSRVGWIVKLKVTMAPTPVTVTPAATVNKDYGQTLKPSDISIAEITGDGVNKEDFKTLAALGLSEVPGEEDHTETNANENYTIKYGEQTIGRYKITFNGNTEVTVKQATPQLKWVNASGVEKNGTLEDSTPTGVYVNPFTKKPVTGSFAWDGDTDGPLTESENHWYTFTPSDGNNYTGVKGNVFVAVGGDISSGDSSGSLIQPKLTVADLVEVTYNGQPQTMPVKVSSYPRDLKYEYRKQGTDGWIYGMPTDVGTYDIRITAEVTAGYKSASTTSVLIINPKPLYVAISVQNVVYTGRTDANVIAVGNLTGILPEDAGKVSLPKDFSSRISAKFDDPKVGKAKRVHIEASDIPLEGDRAANYCLSVDSLETTADIFERPVSLTVNNVTKYYGQPLTFAPSDFTAGQGSTGQGLVEGDVVDSLEATFSSEGTNPTAPVDSYSVTAVSSSKNYKIEKVKGTMKVAQAMPEGTVAALKGAANAELSTIAASLHGTFKNPYNDEPVPGKVTWKDDKQSISSSVNEAKPFEYIFTPEDKTNYTTVTGQVMVTAANGVPAPIEIVGNTSLVYTGDPQPISIKPVEKVTFKVQYRLKDQDSWGDTAPKNVGSYQAKITATAGSGSGYVDNDSTVEIVITPATPTAVKPSGVKAGDTLSDVKPAIQGVKGETVSGTFTWGNVGEKTPAEVKVAAGTSYGWTFTPDDGVINYTVASGSFVLVDPPAPVGGGGGGGGMGGGAGELLPEEAGPSLAPEAAPDKNGTAKAEVTEDAVSSGIQDAKDNKQDSVVIAPQVEGSADKVSVEVPQAAVSDVAKAGLALKVETDVADITLPAASLNELAGQKGSTVTVSAAAVSGTDQVSIEVAVDGKAISSVGGGLNVSVPAAKGGNVLVMINKDGTETVVKKSVVDGKLAAAILDGSCTVAVREKHTAFPDVSSGDWYNGAVDFASSHELFSGTDSGFAPKMTMSRAMLATVLWHLEDSPAAAESSFGDLDGTSWYVDAVGWAADKGIISGYDGSFKPDDPITREQMATILYQYAGKFGMDISASGSLSRFSDSGKVTGYAEKAMEWAVGAGLMSGSGGMLNPGGEATRAEVAGLLQNFLTWMVK